MKIPGVIFLYVPLLILLIYFGIKYYPIETYIALVVIYIVLLLVTHLTDDRIDHILDHKLTWDKQDLIYSPLRIISIIWLTGMIIIHINRFFNKYFTINIK